jgi:hypothetical protein
MNEPARLVSGEERFTVTDLYTLTDLVATTWTAAADLDWSVPAGTVEWSCIATADHAVDCVYAPAFFLASQRQDAYPVAGSNLELGMQAAPALLVESLRIATRILAAVVSDTAPNVRSIIFQRPPTVGVPADFVPRAALELILHGNDVAAGLGVHFEPPADLCGRLREHTRPWPAWDVEWNGLGRTDDPWFDLLTASGRQRARRTGSNAIT